MSGNMFPQHHSTPLSEKSKPPIPMPNSKIPIPSPRPLRRSFSLRMKGEKLSTPAFSSTESNRKPPASGRFSATGKNEGNTAQSSSNNRPTEGSLLLSRRHSFMASGERRGDENNAGGGEKYAKRPDHVKITTPGSVRMPRSPVEGGTTAVRGGGYVNSPDTPSRVRSLSLSLSNAKVQNSRSPTTVVTSSPNYLTKNFSSSNLDRWDTDSITSIGSSVASCDHASVARNGTTFSGRSMKYVFHCNQHAGATGEDYLTPTQRAQRQVKKLKYLLHQAKKDLEEKDSDILKLTKEVVELRLFKAALNSPDDKSNSSDAITVRENTSEETTPVDIVDKGLSNHNVTHEYTCSRADSGHFEDCTSSSVHSKDSVLLDEQRSPSKHLVETSDKATLANFGLVDHDEEHSRIVMEYERRLQELIKTHEEESYQLKQKHNDKIEELLQKITEINTRYWQLVPELETARERIKELEQRLEEASKNLEEQECKARETYRKMYEQGKEAAKFEQDNVAVELAHQNPSRISVPELLKELQVTKNELDNIRAMYRQLTEAKSKNKIDPEITLQFLKSAVYYFLTDKENSQGHLKAIQSILGFSSNEISNIDKAWFT